MSLVKGSEVILSFMPSLSVRFFVKPSESPSILRIFVNNGINVIFFGSYHCNISSLSKIEPIHLPDEFSRQ